MSKKNTSGQEAVTLAVPMLKADLDEFREYCKIIDSDPRDVVYGFVKAIINGWLGVERAGKAPMNGGVSDG